MAPLSLYWEGFLLTERRLGRGWEGAERIVRFRRRRDNYNFHHIQDLKDFCHFLVISGSTALRPRLCLWPVCGFHQPEKESPAFREALRLLPLQSGSHPGGFSSNLGHLTPLPAKALPWAGRALEHPLGIFPGYPSLQDGRHLLQAAFSDQSPGLSCISCLDTAHVPLNQALTPVTYHLAQRLGCSRCSTHLG